MPIEIEPGSELDKAAQEFLAAARKYRQAVKKYAPKQFGGIIWLKAENEVVIYSESGRYANQIGTMTFNEFGNEIVFTVLPGEEE